MSKRLLLLSALLAAAALAQAQTPEPEPAAADAADAAVEAEARAAKAQQQLEEKFLNVERRLIDQNELGLRRLEHVEERIESAQHHLDRLALIFGLSILVIFLFIGNNLSTRLKTAELRVRRATEDSQNLMRDIQRELSRPEVHHLHIGQILRRLLRQLREKHNPAFVAADMEEVRKASNDPYLPVSLYLIARILVAEYDKDWSMAVQMLEQLREMDEKDPDILLHLSHVHKHIASTTADGKVRDLHERLCYEYYGKFTALMKAENAALEDAAPIAPPPQDVQTPAMERAALAAPAADAAAPAAAPPAQPAPAPAAQPAPAAPAAVPLSASAPAAQPAAVPATPATAPAATPAPATAQPAATTPTPTAAQPAVTSASAPTPRPAAAPAAAPAPVAPVPAAPAPATPAAVAQPAAQPPSTLPAAVPAKGGNFLANLPSPRAGVARLRGLAFPRAAFSAAKNTGGMALGAFTRLIRQTDDTPMPFLPVPATSVVPKIGEKDKLAMWQDIRRGDLTMAKATSAGSMRERNRLIDDAAVCYAQAQAHSTNETLYYNWGIALLAKALHVPEKKRAPFYNAAVDKFLAGNVIAPHYFDFHLATLYAVIGSKGECRKWLEIAREHGSLDASALRQAPDFDSVRQEPWFKEFMG